MKSVMASLFFILNLSTISVLTWSQQPKEPDWEPSLAYGGAPECPEHFGDRTHRSETVSNGRVNVAIIGKSTRSQGSGCARAARIEFTGSLNRSFQLPDPGKRQFAIVDFSADSKKLLLSADKEMELPNLYRRYVDVASMELANGQAHWVNVWDIFGWHECDASVEPQGFTQDGYVILRARPSVWVSSSRPNCVSDIGLYRTDLVHPPVRLPNDTKVPRFGKAIIDAAQACKTDPDIFGACFTVHGRLSAWNGSHSLRIWRVGTKRILGTRDEPLPENLAKEMGWGVEAWGDFVVCPYTKERPGVMQSVCIESADHVFYKK
jgi:hypothetical protein